MSVDDLHSLGWFKLSYSNLEDVWNKYEGKHFSLYKLCQLDDGTFDVIFYSDLFDGVPLNRVPEYDVTVCGRSGAIYTEKVSPYFRESIADVVFYFG